MNSVDKDVKMQEILYIIDTHHKEINRYRSLLLLFLDLTLEQRELAIFGIQRHFYYCRKSGVTYDVAVIREIIVDAKQNKCYAKEMQDDIESKTNQQVLRRRNVFVHSLSFSKKVLSKKSS